ncbi:LacI family DNA-binding transcriptional regulator [Brachybacterium hainanense]|uniref:LacI family DNA-binding transcriptional regulator n=1 Tax=Brachybacterium hainanense TaxID=1541174 RepID=A0ABV6RC76_9MICO
MEETRSTTVRDVARAAGVSPGTVSKAINGTGSISPATRARVLATAEELDYRPNDLARSVFERRSFTVGMITTDSFGRFSVPVMLGAEDALGAGRISVFLCDSRDDPIRERHYIDVLQRRRVDGFIVTGRSSNPRPPLEVPRGMPVVYAHAPSTEPHATSVLIDDVRTGELATEHLIDTGRRRIAAITGPERFLAAHQRVRGHLAALAAAGLEPVRSPLGGEWTEQWGRHATHLLLREHPDIDGIMCGSDLIARGVMDSLRELGRSVPDDVAVVGIDNWELIADGARPSLTSVDTNLQELGRTAAQRLLEAIDGRPRRGAEHIAPRLVIRESTELG